MQNLVETGSVVSEKSKSQFCYVNYLGLRSSYDLYLDYSHTFIYSITGLHLPTFRSKAAIVFFLIHCFHFSYRKIQFTKLDLAVKWVKGSTQSHHLYKLCRARCCMPSLMIIDFTVLEKTIFKGFYHICAWRPSWSFDLDHLYKLVFSS